MLSGSTFICSSVLETLAFIFLTFALKIKLRKEMDTAISDSYDFIARIINARRELLARKADLIARANEVKGAA